MNLWKLTARNLRYHVRSLAGVWIGIAVAAGVLAGALATGDSVRWTLRQNALARLGEVEYALSAGDRFFTETLVRSLQNRTQQAIAPALHFQGTLSHPAKSFRASKVQVYGVGPDFFPLVGIGQERVEIAPGEVLINRLLADHLQVAAGNDLLVQIPRPTQLSREAPVAPQEDNTVTIRLRVSRIWEAQAPGNFSLQANQLPPFNAFISLPLLQRQTGLTNRCNLLLAGPGLSRSDSPKAMPQANPQPLQDLIAELWQPEDAQLEILSRPELNQIELRSTRVFLEPQISVAATAMNGAQPVFTYLVNRIVKGDRMTPYSMVSGVGQGFWTQSGMAQNPSPVPGQPVSSVQVESGQIVANQWLADDLQAKPGDTISIAYYVVGPGRALLEQSNRFVMQHIVPMAKPALDPLLMPDFPGLTDAESCRDWDAGFAIDTSLIRPKDEEYWDHYRGSPKAYLSIADAQIIWSNRFGNLTAVRYPLTSTPGPAVTPTSLWTGIKSRLQPADAGLVFEPVRARALAASSQGQDFGQLFLGFSFYLVTAALILVWLLFTFNVEQRRWELGVFQAAGWRTRSIRKLMLREGLFLAVTGSIAGAAAGLVYAWALLKGLSTIWRSAVSNAALEFHVTIESLVVGAGLGVILALFTIWRAVRKQTRLSTHELLSAGGEIEQEKSVSPAGALLLATASTALAGMVIAAGFMVRDKAVLSFFVGGTLVLVAGFAYASAFLSGISVAETTAPLGLGQLSLRNMARRRRRTLATMSMFAAGSFLIAAIQSNRLALPENPANRKSGTGGFAFIAESALPIVQDLNSSSGSDFYGLDPVLLAGVNFVPFRLHEGDDASCLNLNRAQQPRILGVNPSLLKTLDAFVFSAKVKTAEKPDNWDLLNYHPNNKTNLVPAIGDSASIKYALGKSVGSAITQLDQKGNPFQLWIVGGLANSIMQGSLIISEQDFINRFPSDTGYRFFLIDAPSNRLDQVRAHLSRALEDTGFELIPAQERLAQLNAVQNTYLSTFALLGGIGLIIGSFGLGVLVLRNVLERRNELAMLLAVGFRRGKIFWLIVTEHVLLVTIGLLIGIIAGGLAIAPALSAPGMQLPIATLITSLGLVFVAAVLWTVIAAKIALSGDFLEVLRNQG